MHPSIYDLKIRDKNKQYLTDIHDYENPSTKLGRALVSNDLSFARSSSEYNVYGPDPFIPFKSIDHLDQGKYSNSLMRPDIGPGQQVRQVDNIVMDILGNLGW